MATKLSGNYNNKLEQYRQDLSKIEEHILRYILDNPGRDFNDIKNQAQSFGDTKLRETVNSLEDRDFLLKTSRNGYILTDQAVDKLEGVN